MARTSVAIYDPRVIERVSVIIPATNQPPTLDAAVAAIRAAAEPPEEIVVVTEPPEAGPAAARNEGVRHSSGTVLVFVDADVEVHPDVFTRFRSAFDSDSALAAIFGSYDDDPRAEGLVSDFRNLLHHHVHQNAAGPATTFWAGLGAVRRDAFLGVGGFDERRYQHASIEDIEFGMRLRTAGGRIALDPRIQGTHLKHWTLLTMMQTDLLRRGAPWVELMLTRRVATSDLNLGWRHRFSTVAILVLVRALARRRYWRASFAVAALVTLNWSFYRLLFMRRGWRLAIAAVPLHAIHHLCGAAAVPLGLLLHLNQKSREAG